MRRNVRHRWVVDGDPYPVYARMRAEDPVYYVEHTLKSWAKSGTLSHFSPEALAHYRALLQEPERVHAVCEDYRAGATVDWQHDEADMAGGRRIACPTFLLWGSHYLGRGGAKPLEVWRSWCSGELSGAAIDSGHFQAEENPEDTLAALVPFLTAQKAAR
jgi:haloacetate dehalogenase